MIGSCWEEQETAEDSHEVTDYFLVAMRLGGTPVPIPNTMVKTQTADGTILETVWESRWLPDLWGYSSVGRAPALQAGGQEFESPYLHWIIGRMVVKSV